MQCSSAARQNRADFCRITDFSFSSFGDSGNSLCMQTANISSIAHADSTSREELQVPQAPIPPITDSRRHYLHVELLKWDRSLWCRDAWNLTTRHTESSVPCRGPTKGCRQRQSLAHVLQDAIHCRHHRNLHKNGIAASGLKNGWPDCQRVRGPNTRAMT